MAAETLISGDFYDEENFLRMIQIDEVLNRSRQQLEIGQAALANSSIVRVDNGGTVREVGNNRGSERYGRFSIPPQLGRIVAQGEALRYRYN